MKPTSSMILRGALCGLALCAAGHASAGAPLPVLPPSGAQSFDVTALPSGLSMPDCDPYSPPLLADGGIDHGCPIQAALNALATNGGGVLHLPAGTYDVDRTLVVGDNTWIVGAGTTLSATSTIIRRGPSLGQHSEYQSKCSGTASRSTRRVFVNADYNCGNTNITLTNFTVDGAGVGAGQDALLAFSAVHGLHIWNVEVLDARGDGIYIKNGGVDTSVRDSRIDGFGGIGINVTMLSNGYRGNRSNSSNGKWPPLTVAGNVVIGSDSAGSQAIGISVGRSNNQPAARHPMATIQDNVVDVTESQIGINCLNCHRTKILGNTVKSSLSDGDGLFKGIMANGRGLRVMDNRVLGNGGAGDGRGILVRNGPSTKVKDIDAIVTGNLVRNKNVGGGANIFAALEVSGLSEFTVMNNRVEDIAGAPGIAIGYCFSDIPTTFSGMVAANHVSMRADAQHLAGYVVRRAPADIHFMNNMLHGAPLALSDVELCQSPAPTQR